jgi:penicillin amidase
MRRLACGLAAFGAAVAVMVAAGFLWLRTSLPQIDGTITLAGLDKEVEVLRDEHGVPHIFAATANDAYFALGFVHAQDRLWQMELMRRAGAGRLAEILGERALPNDRFVRSLGLYRLAERSVEDMPADLRAALEAYARGVNALIEDNPAALPPEFIALRHRPEKWRPADSLVWGRLMAMMLAGNWHAEALRARLATRLSAKQIRDLWPEIPAGRVVEGKAEIEVGRLAGALLDAVPPELRPTRASNAWAVAGAHTASGKPLLATDPHLGHRVPEVWYLVRIDAPGLMLAGATTPGVPFVVIGHNGRVAWGLTSTHGDTEDLFVERLDPSDADRYLTPVGPREFERRTETILVRDRAPVMLEVRATRHGPVIAGLNERIDAAAPAHHVLALASPGLRPDDRTAEALWRLNRARGRADVEGALRLFDAPQQNVVFADIDGNIGMVSAGLVPVRRSGDGMYPAPGWTGERDWTGFLPYEALPRTTNPPEGRLANGNNRPPLPDGYPHFLGKYWFPPYRAERVLERIDQRRTHTPATMADIQMDIVSNVARDLLGLMLEVQPTDELSRRALALLTKWDGTMDALRPEPLIFVAWLRALVRVVASDELGPLFSQVWDLKRDFVKLVLAQENTWCDNVATPQLETCGDALASSLSQALAGEIKSRGNAIEKWRWGDTHVARFRHIPFTHVPVLRTLADIVVPIGGDDETVACAAMIVAGPTPYEAVHGPGMRAVFDFADLAASRFVIATGQSGNPLSAHYDDLNPLWRTGRSITLGGLRTALRQTAEGELLLVPLHP